MRTLGFILAFLLLLWLTGACIGGYLECALDIKYHYGGNTSSGPGQVALYKSYAFLSGAGICILAMLGLAAFGSRLFRSRKS